VSDNTLSVSIIIPHWNNVDILSDCLESINSTKLSSFEIIVVDNASSDHSVDWVKSNYPRVNLIENDKNYGYAGGCNIGADHAKGDKLVFLNNDTVLEPDCIPLMLRSMNANPNMAAVQPKVLNYFDKKLFDYAGGAGGHMDIYCYPIARGRIFTEQEYDHGQYDNKEKCFWVSGACFMIRKNLFHNAGGFDDVFFAHMEEIDLCWKIQSMGYEVWTEPEAIIYHKNGLTLPMYSHKKYYLNHRNSLLMLFGNYSFKNILLNGVVRIFLEIVSIFYSFLIFDWKHASAIIRALFWVFFHPHVIIKKRRAYNKIRKKEDSEIMKGMFRRSVVLKYYILRIKTYSGILSK
jgi:GT2 family glycosyltransferase